jgi:hypothetical protein
MAAKQMHRKKQSSGGKEDLVARVYGSFPKVISPQAHALIDVMTFTALLGLTQWMVKRSSRAAAVMGLNTAAEGSVALFTNYPPGVVPVIPFDIHIRIGLVYTPLSLGLAALLPRIPPRERTNLCLVPLVPFLLNALSKPR